MGQAYGEVLGRDYGIAMTAAHISALTGDRAKVEIEVMAAVPTICFCWRLCVGAVRALFQALSFRAVQRRVVEFLPSVSV